MPKTGIVRRLFDLAKKIKEAKCMEIINPLMLPKRLQSMQPEVAEIDDGLFFETMFDPMGNCPGGSGCMPQFCDRQGCASYTGW